MQPLLYLALVIIDKEEQEFEPWIKIQGAVLVLKANYVRPMFRFVSGACLVMISFSSWIGFPS